MSPNESWPHVAYTLKDKDDRHSRMRLWCDQTCNKPWCHVHVGWYHEAWGFTDPEDVRKFNIVWSEYVVCSAAHVYA